MMADGKGQGTLMNEVTIYHNPACGTSRTTLGLIRTAGFEPSIIEYLKTPPDKATLESLLGQQTPARAQN